VSATNQWIVKNPQAFFCSLGCFLFYNSSDITVEGGDFENNDVGTSYSTIQMFGNPLEGNHGLTVLGGYYQGNGGTAEFEFDQTATGQPNAEHAIHGIEEGRSGSAGAYVNHVVWISNAQSGQQTSVDVRGSSFWGYNSYAPSAGRTYFAVSNPTTANYKITGYGSNSYASSIEAPWLCAFGTNCQVEDDGHLEEWGTATTSSGSPFSVNVTWPLACPTAVDNFMVTLQNGSAPNGVGSGGPSTTGVTIYTANGPEGTAWRLKCH